MPSQRTCGSVIMEEIIVGCIVLCFFSLSSLHYFCNWKLSLYNYIFRKSNQNSYHWLLNELFSSLINTIFFISHLAILIGVVRIGNQRRFQTFKLVKQGKVYEVLCGKCSGYYRNRKIELLNLRLIGTEQKMEAAYYFIFLSRSPSLPPPIHFYAQ